MPAQMFDEVLKDSLAVGDVHVSSAGESPKAADRKRQRRKWTEKSFWSEIGKLALTRQLRMIDGENAHSPFPYDANAMGDLRPDQVPRFLGAITNPENLETRDVSLNDLTAMQNRVHAGKVEAIRQSGDTGGKPAVVVRNNGRNYIADGHHRLAADWLHGKKTATVAFKDLTPVDQAVKRFSTFDDYLKSEPGHTKDQPRDAHGRFGAKPKNENPVAVIGGDATNPAIRPKDVVPLHAPPKTSNQLAVRNTKLIVLGAAAIAAGSFVAAMAVPAAAALGGGAAVMAGAHALAAGTGTARAVGYIAETAMHVGVGMWLKAGVASATHALSELGYGDVADKAATWFHHIKELVEGDIFDAVDETLRKDAPPKLSAHEWAQIEPQIKAAFEDCNTKFIETVNSHPEMQSVVPVAAKTLDQGATAFLSAVRQYFTGGIKKSEFADIPFTVEKADSDKQMLFGWASVVEKDGKIIVDKQGDMIAPETLEDGAYDYVLHARDHGHMHENIGTGRLIESMVFTKEKQTALGIDLGKVGWWIGFKVDDPEVWAAHKRGDLPEFSIGGRALREEVE